ncbi:hypothetical protein SEA_PHINKY_56 [Microbacterium phage Phinky]|nr:hypothetical protein SEA_PHINKY_56 [Microbacterium phage Phinky]
MSDKIPMSLRWGLAWAALTGRYLTISYANGRYAFEVKPDSVSRWVKRNHAGRAVREQQRRDALEMKELLVEATAQKFYELTSVAVIVPWQRADESEREKYLAIAAWSHGGAR